MASFLPPPRSLAVLFLVTVASAQLSPTFYDSSCPDALSKIKSMVEDAVDKEKRMGASLLRMHFHDCFVNASSLLQIKISILLCTYVALVNKKTNNIINDAGLRWIGAIG